MPKETLCTFLRPDQYRKLLGVARSTECRYRHDGLIPPPIKIGPRSVALPDTEVRSIQKARIAGATDDDIRTLVKRLVAARTREAGQ